MIAAARQVIVVADHSKWAVRGLSTFAPSARSTCDHRRRAPGGGPGRGGRAGGRDGLRGGHRGQPHSPAGQASRARGRCQRVRSGRECAARAWCSVGGNDGLAGGGLAAGAVLPAWAALCSARRMASSIRVSTMADSGTVAMTSPRTKIWPLPLPEATPRSALAGLARAIDDAAHDRDPQRDLQPVQPGGDLLSQLVHVHLGPGRRTGRTRSPGAAAACRATPEWRCQP